LSRIVVLTGAARSTRDPGLVRQLGERDIERGDLGEQGS
jgi:hypothetical protein